VEKRQNFIEVMFNDTMKKQGLMGRVKDRIKDSFIYQEGARAGRILKYSKSHMASVVGGVSLIGYLGLSLSGCGDGPTELPIDSPPTSGVLNLDRTSGEAPFETGVRYFCTDDKGIKNYKLMKDGAVIYSGQNPIDTSLTFSEPGNYSLRANCTDTGGQTASSSTVPVQVQAQPLKKIYQTFERVNDADLVRSVTLENIPQATLKTLRNGNALESRIISSPYADTLRNALKGDYMSVVEAAEVVPDTATANVPDYIPTAPDVGGLNPEMNEGDSAVVYLSRAVDRNNEDNPVRYLSVISTDGKTQPYLLPAPNDSVAVIKTSQGATGPFQIELMYGDGQTGTVTVGGQIHDLLDVEGILEDNEQHQRQPGVVRVYNASDSTLLGEIAVSGTGEFNQTLEQRVADLSGDIFIQARRFPNGDTTAAPTSYIRTIKVPAQDQRGLLMRVVPNGVYVQEDFKQFMRELAGSIPNTRFDFLGEYIPDFQGLQGIEILPENPFGTQYGTFTPEQRANIKSKILNPNDISGIIGNYLIDSAKVWEDDQGNYTLFGNPDDSTDKIIPNEGWIIVSPKTNMSAAGLAQYLNYGRLIKGGVIYMSGGGSNAVISHEFGHMFLGTGHPTVFGSDQTVMNASADRLNMGSADKKAGWIIYEPTFMILESGLYHVDGLENILALNWIK